ncbi:hypothetical protein [Candidatus Magnetaquicoccus inordinatus]|uniref:hypothetical protein n=1 Tax=Candidatus Magnetaquicoccus inordinatus TaxID=2496818 RepID=UPI00102AA9BE|nr:hypothetical protein [Candidatus Magnetaquicoccus inordinatus]
MLFTAKLRWRHCWRQSVFGWSMCRTMVPMLLIPWWLQGYMAMRRGVCLLWITIMPWLHNNHLGRRFYNTGIFNHNLRWRSVNRVDRFYDHNLFDRLQNNPL